MRAEDMYRAEDNDRKNRRKKRGEKLRRKWLDDIKDNKGLTIEDKWNKQHSRRKELEGSLPLWNVKEN